MKKVLSLLLVASMVLWACSKKEVSCPAVTFVAPTAEVANLKAFLDSSKITATADPRGFFYVIKSAGSATKPTVCQTISVAYVGTLTNGQTFDSNTDFVYPLSNLILGWQEGTPLVGAGGSIVLYLPPSLGYGASAQGGIPANSNLIFSIDLKGFN